MQNNFNEIANETEEMLKEEKNSSSEEQKTKSLIEESVHASWAGSYLKKRKLKKIIKASAICALASFVTMGCAFMMAASWKAACNKILDKNNYGKSNAMYKQEATTDLAVQLANEEITYDEYQAKIDDIKDLDKVAYLKDNASEEDFRKYKRFDTAIGAGVYVGMSTAALGILSLGTVAGIEGRLKDEENERNAHNARISRILGR